MEQDLELQQLLDEIKRDIGIEFAVVSECPEGRRVTVEQLRRLIKSYKTGYQPEYFLERVLNEELTSAQFYQEAKKFHIDISGRFRVYYIEICQEYDIDVQAILKSLFASQSAVYVIPVDAVHFAVLKGIRKRDSDAADTAHIILDMLNTEAMLDARVAYGVSERQLEHLRESYGEARLAMKIGRIFHMKERIFIYDRLGISRLIYELPVSVCRAYVQEVFKGKLPQKLDAEMISTINTFFDNGLNISETARKLYVHRNTLVYRLEKIQNAIGLDIRDFEDAMTYKIVAMAIDYIHYVEKGIIH